MTQPSQENGWLQKLRPYLTTDTPNDSGEFPMRCPLHAGGKERKPSASINFDKGVWNCFATCGGGTIKDLMARLAEEDGVGTKSYDPESDNVVDFEAKREEKATGKKRAPLNRGRVTTWKKDLQASPELLRKFCVARDLSAEIVDRFDIGWQRSSGRFTLPVYVNGKLVNVRRYKLEPDADEPKMVNLTGHGLPYLYPYEELAHDELLIVEGELDALCAIQHGYHAVSSTHGADKWLPEWSRLFRGKQVFISYDNDAGGRIGAKRVQQEVSKHAEYAVILPPLSPEEKSDLTDYFIAGNTEEDFEKVLRLAHSRFQVEQTSEDRTLDPLEKITVQESLRGHMSGKPVKIDVTVLGNGSAQPFHVPQVVQMSCTMDNFKQSPICKSMCPMAAQNWGGDHRGEIRSTEVEAIAKFCDVSDKQLDQALKEHFKIPPRCRKITLEAKVRMVVDEVAVVNLHDHSSTRRADLQPVAAYVIGQPTTIEPNEAATLVGATIPIPKSERAVFFAWDQQKALTSIDDVHVTADMVRRLDIFRPHRLSVLDKCKDIAEDLSANVTRIFGRWRMHTLMDIVWHSALQFYLGGKLIKGTLDVPIVGDTRTGKSETAKLLSLHYKLGHIVNCEGVSFAGLVGGVQRIGIHQNNIVTWGEIPFNDRRLVALDEASGLHREIIENLSGIRSEGIAQITKIVQRQTSARCRLIWIANPKDVGGQSQHTNLQGVEILQRMMPMPEDIARFDLAMSVRSSDISEEEMNEYILNPPKVTPVYTSDLCHELLLWAWSRTAEQIHFIGNAEAEVQRAASRLGQIYIDDPPLIQSANARVKVAKVAVALAMRTFSADSSGENVQVREAHVEAAEQFINRLYGYPNFGYRDRSNWVKANQRVAQSSMPECKTYLLSNTAVLEFLRDRRGQSFRPQDLMSMAMLDRTDASEVLNKFSKWKMIRQEKAQIYLNAELLSVIREIDNPEPPRRRRRRTE